MKPVRYGFFLFVCFFVINAVFISILFIVSKVLGLTFIYQLILLLLAVAAGALFCAYLVLSSAPVLKNYLSNLRTLYRLDNLSHPLLLKLSSSAYGTYNHSINVANLAHKAAKAIKSDALQVRVGGYFHDIGKISAPERFTENQNKENIHENMEDPRASAKMVIQHIKDGVALAKEYNLPAEIVDFIPQHHGTLPVSSFLQVAKNKKMKIKKEDFYYPGPRPLNRETALVMLSDSIEAIVRSQDNLTPAKIKELITAIIDEREKNGQLQYSGLTPTDVGKIKKAFFIGCQGIFHQRIKYPQPVLVEGKK